MLACSRISEIEEIIGRNSSSQRDVETADL
jgi:hypothetical protein